MDRRALLLGAGSMLLASPRVAGAQQTGKVWRIGVLSPGPFVGAGTPALLRQTLRDLGYVDGQNVLFEAAFDETSNPVQVGVIRQPARSYVSTCGPGPAAILRLG